MIRLRSGSLVGFLSLAAGTILLCSSCSVQKKINRRAAQTLLNASSLQAAHTGISIFDPAANTYLFDYQGDKYFVPASNTKIPTCYLGMKYLGDSIVGAEIEESANAIRVYGTGDPTFLHPDFRNQPVFDYLQSRKNDNIWLIRKSVPEKTRPVPALGSGWSWNDYDASYMAERNFFPIYGNIARFFIDEGQLQVVPNYFRAKLSHAADTSSALSVTREKDQNFFVARGTQASRSVITIPFKTGSDFDVPKARYISNTAANLLADTLGLEVQYAETYLPAFSPFKKIKSQPVDSVLKPMMHRSDNFFAEQTLLMVSQAKLGYLGDADIIDTVLKTDFNDLPQKPRWVDGSGLSRYNLFTPRDFISILNKMQTEFGMERVKSIFPTGGADTISSYYKADSGYIFAKTGTLSGVVALSGFLYTKKNRLLLFSVLVNNHQSSATEIRRTVEQFIQYIRRHY